MCRLTTATTCELVVEAKCQSVKVATNGWRNLSAPDVPANGIAVENVRYANSVFHVDKDLYIYIYIYKTLDFN